ncbi:MAG: hypothetical protein ACRBFS_23010 [Aureispira sp.]
MKKLLIILLALSPFFATAQTVNDIPISELETNFIQIVGTQKLLSKKVMVTIDFGQEQKLLSAKVPVIKNQAGKTMTFMSMIDALNFFSDLGYKFEQAYTLTVGNQNVYHYLLSKK